MNLGEKNFFWKENKEKTNAVEKTMQVTYPQNELEPLIFFLDIKDTNTSALQKK